MKEIVVTLESCATFLPQKSVSNDDLVAQGMETSDEWIVKRTGIKSRHIAQGDGETTAAMALEASKKALEKAKMKPEDLDMIIVATCTPSLIYPSVATQVQGGLGTKTGFAFDIAAACSGFIYGISFLDAIFRSQPIENALLIGVDSISRTINWENRDTAVLFGDGAGVVTAKRSNGNESGVNGAKGTNQQRGILESSIYSDGQYVDLLKAGGGPGSDGREKGFIHMDGPALFKIAVGKLSDSITSVLEKARLSKDDVDWFVPHQANKRILDAVAQRVGLCPDKVVVTIDHHGNTSAASVPLALGEAVEDGRIKKGDLVLMEAMGSGVTWGASLVRW